MKYHYGGKANSLLILQDIDKVRVPHFIIITSDELMKIQSSERFIQWWQSQTHTPTFPVCVRSSVNLEDGAAHSFAGLFESEMNIPDMDTLFQKIVFLRDQFKNDKVQAYCTHHHINLDELRLNLIIQQQVDSTISGVLFTVNPHTGNGFEMMTEVVYGQGEALVQGQVNPEVYTIDWKNDTVVKSEGFNQEKALTLNKNGGLEWHKIESNAHILSQNKLSTLKETVLNIQQHYGFPLDIEYAYDDEVLYILQARPMTSITFLSDYDWTNADLRDGGISSEITTPMMSYLYGIVLENSMPTFFKNIGIIKKEKYSNWYHKWLGYGYWNLTAVKNGARKIPGYKEKVFDKGLGIEGSYEGNGEENKLSIFNIWKGLEILTKTNKSINSRAKVYEEVRKRSVLQFKKWEELLKNTEINHDNYSEIIQEIIAHHLYLECNYFYAVYDSTNAATFCNEALVQYNKKNNPVNYLDLVSGIENIAHLRPNISLYSLAQMIKQDQDAISFYRHISPSELKSLNLSQEPFPFHKEWNKIIDSYKHKSQRELDLLVPNWDEDYEPCLSLLQLFIKDDKIASPEALTLVQKEKFSTIFDSIKSSSFKKKIQQHRKMLWLREEFRDLSCQGYYWIRLLLLKVSQYLIDHHWLQEEKDIFFLDLNMLATGDKNSFQSLVAKEKIYYQSFRNYPKPNEIISNTAPPVNNYISNQGEIKGYGGAPGWAEATARVILHIEDATHIQPNEILVTKYTDPGWTYIFSKIAGIVTETGGTLSHGAIVAREFGIPAVLPVKDACARIKTGDKLLINGYDGTVKILS